jgi:hypothetical protein
MGAVIAFVTASYEVSEVKTEIRPASPEVTRTFIHASPTVGIKVDAVIVAIATCAIVLTIRSRATDQKSLLNNIMLGLLMG